jgi:hypothetical protein
VKKEKQIRDFNFAFEGSAVIQNNIPRCWFSRFTEANFALKSAEDIVNEDERLNIKNMPVIFILELGLVGLYQVWEKVHDFNEFLLCILMTVGLSGESKERPKHAEPNRAGPLVSLNIAYLCDIVATWRSIQLRHFESSLTKNASTG